MKLLYLSGRTNLLSIKFLALLFSMVLGPSVVLAGGMPPDVEKEVMMEQSAEVEEPSPEAKEASPEVKEETVAEQSADASTEAVKELPETQENLSAGSSGFTVGVRGALSILNSDSVSAASVEFGGSQYGPLGGSVNYNNGYNFSFMLGYALGNGLRLETEAGYINNGFQEIDLKMPGTLGTELQIGENKLKGDLSALTLMLNAYYDIDLGYNLVPYIGGGLGAADLSNEMEPDGGTSVSNLLVDDSDSVFIYQVGAGLGYKISRYSDITVSLDYRYLASFEDPRFKEELTGNFIEGEFGGHYIGGGVRLRLW